MTMQTPHEDRSTAREPAAHVDSAPATSPAVPARGRRALVPGLGCVVLALLAAGIVPKLDARKAQAAQVAVQRELNVSTAISAHPPKSENPPQTLSRQGFHGLRNGGPGVLKAEYQPCASSSSAAACSMRAQYSGSA